MLSYCFRNSALKPEFGPYFPAAFDTTINVICFKFIGIAQQR